jgi:hypothetical protein
MNSENQGDDISQLPTNPLTPPASQGQLEYLHGLFQAFQKGAVDPDEHEKAIEGAKFGNVKKAGAVTLLFALLSMTFVDRGTALFVENKLFRNLLISLIFFLLAFLSIRFL